ncbi:MAG: adenylate cyclase [Cognaticolwellia sp.]|jgi:adenylate cyclase
MSDTPDTLQRWLLTVARARGTVPELLEALSARLRQSMPLDRLFCGTTILHPQAAAWAWIWTPATPVRTLSFSFAEFQRLGKRDSPVRRLERGATEVHWTAAQGPTGMADVDELHSAGFTAFLALSIHFRGRWVGAFTFATRHPQGFNQQQLQLLRDAEHVLAAIVQPLAQDLVTSTLLRTYLGRDAGERVFRGNVQRGEGEMLRAAVWMSDVRRFTWLSTQLEPAALLQLLNQIFEATVEVVEAHGGQVLKFIGDGLLAVFVGDGEIACTSALSAALALRVRLDQVRTERHAAGLTFTDVGVGLHYGDVTYGNIGAPGRLDFTVIGSAVNLAARIEGLCSPLGASVLASEAFQARAPADWADCGAHRLKGVAEPAQIYAPAGPAPKS